MELKIKTFTELNTKELYEILKVRSEIFVVEQNCIYQDMDDTDYRSVHIFFEENGIVEAYLRIFEKDPANDIIQIGRVLTRIHGQGLGGELLKEGFQICSEEFLEDGIPHVEMKLICRPL